MLGDGTSRSLSWCGVCLKAAPGATLVLSVQRFSLLWPPLSVDLHRAVEKSGSFLAPPGRRECTSRSTVQALPGGKARTSRSDSPHFPVLLNKKQDVSSFSGS